MTAKQNSNTPRHPTILVILDGFGHSEQTESNAIFQANTPRLDELFVRWPHTLITSSGKQVGLPAGQMGNSEVGHMTLGCGSTIRQDLVKIDNSIENGDFFSNTVLLKAIETASQQDRPLHLMGLVSDGGVHSHIRHLDALFQLCIQHQVRPALHVITDGRDTPPQSACLFIDQIMPRLEQANGYIATVMGRYYAMDRDQRWDRTERAWRALIIGSGKKADSVYAAINNSYANKVYDEFIVPTVLPQHHPLDANDQLIFFNFRKDRPRQLVAALALTNFSSFDRGDFPLINVTCLMPYDKNFNLPFAFSPEQPQTTLAEVISQHNIKQFHCAETEKYAHVTYFFNGGHSTTYSGETHLLIPSPSVATYDLKPEMSAVEVGDAVVKAIKSEKYGFIVVNFANGDMVGHTGKLDAAIHAVEVLDQQVGRIFDVAEEHRYSAILTADHGNCEEMRDERSNTPLTQHTSNPVPCLIMDEEIWELADHCGLSNIAPTVLQLMGIDKPAAMTSESLLIKSKGKSHNRYHFEGAA